MKPALIKSSPPAPQSWLDLPLGEDIKELIEQQIEETSRKFFGYHLVRLGNLSSDIALPACPIKHQVNINDGAQSFKASSHSVITAKSTELPIAENSVDAFLLAHELDFARDPHQILREVDRTIMPNGYVVISGFNPISLCGLLKYLPINKGNVLHEARFFTCTRVKDWLQLLGFEVLEVKHLLFNDLFFQRKMRLNTKWSRWCHKYLSLLSTLYVIVAIKREVPLSIIKPKWKAKTKFSPVGASVRTGMMQAEASCQQPLVKSHFDPKN